ncbi:7-methylguanosine phosphate-specific 5'-nucleotidase A-like isoform X2 [Halichondria panicea]|uniref:7-methylguanosine phosphate-specific 5'-nucleotidase A-like isoform X2 n=1 Tax=Halichondria panicea TaxID=6063 RepID=UPI00312BADAC
MLEGAGMGKLKKMKASLKLPQVLRRSYVHLSQSKEIIMNKIALIRAEGKQKLIVVSDFDLTLTKYRVKGQLGMTSYRVVDTSLQMSEAYRQEALSLRDLYAPIEHNQDLSLQERAQAMEDWTTGANDLLVKHQLRRDDIPNIVAKANVELRPHYHLFSELLSAENIPLLIFSAGLWDSVSEILEQQQGPLGDNAHIVSNRLVFNKAGVAVDYQRPVIHSYRKGTIPDRFMDVKNSIQGRYNVVLLGDTLSDTKMTAGLERVDHVIKIGFLNSNEKELMSKYKERFDIVLTGDPDLSTPLCVLKTILE